MHLSREKKYLDRSKYTLYGRWYYLLCEKLNVNDREMSARSGIHFSSFNVQSRAGKSEPSMETVKRVLEVFHQVAQEKGVDWNPLWDTQFYHAAHYATPDEERIAALLLEQSIVEQKQTEGD